MAETWFIFRGERCDTYGLTLAHWPERAIGAVCGQHFTVPGRAEELFIPDGSHANIALEVHCLTNALYRRGACAEWLQGGAGDLIFADEPDRAYRARVTGGIACRTRASGIVELTIPFLCGPYRYFVPAREYELTQPGSVVPYEGNVAGQPRITVVTSAPFSLETGGTLIECAVGRSIVLDSEARTAVYQADGTPAVVSMDDFPLLQPGNNTVTWRGEGVTQVLVEPRVRER